MPYNVKQEDQLATATIQERNAEVSMKIVARGTDSRHVKQILSARFTSK